MLFPNPVHEQANLRIVLAKAGLVEINIYSLKGDLVLKLDEKNLAAGESNILINTSKLTPGSYLVNAKSGSSVFNQKMVVIK